MAEENKGQEPEQEQGQEQEPVQDEGPAQEPAEEQQKDKPAKEKGEGLLMPVLYALLAAVGAFTLVMVVGIVLTFFFQPAGPEETPPAQQSSQVTLTTSSPEAETQAPQGPDDEDADTGDES